MQSKNKWKDLCEIQLKFGHQVVHHQVEIVYVSEIYN